MIIVKEVGVRMMKEYFEIELSKATPWYGFRKRLKLFGNKGYQAAKDELKKTLLGRECIDIPGAFLQGDWQQDEHPGYIMFEGIMVDMICGINPSFI